jgi:hypothetical protein
MTFSPMVSAAGAAPDPGGTDPGTSPDPGTGPDRAAEDVHADPGQYPGPGQYADPGQAGYAVDPGQAGHAVNPGQEDAGSGQEDASSVPWPNQSFLELGALPTAAPCARLHTTLVLREWQLSGLVQTAALVVSELVSNAVQASVPLTGSRFAGEWAPGTPPVRMWLSADEHRLVIQVWDGSDQPPVPQPVAPEADSGRGLLLVGALSAEWGCYTPENSSGKVVWAVVAG